MFLTAELYSKVKDSQKEHQKKTPNNIMLASVPQDVITAIPTRQREDSHHLLDFSILAHSKTQRIG
jgi:hypothetical protein